MAARCLTLAEFLAAFPQFSTFGGNATGTITFGTPVATNTITIGGAVLTAVGGARTPGSNDWSIDGTVFAQVQSLVDAINDAANALTAIVTASVPTPGVATALVTSVGTGTAANLPWLTNNATEIVLDPLDTLNSGEDELQFFLDCACSMINLDCWADKASNGHGLLTAHLATVSTGAEGGAISSKSIDKISVGFATTAFDTTDAAFSSTRFGRMYLALRSTIVVFPIVGTGLPRTFRNNVFFRRRGI